MSDLTQTSFYDLLGVPRTATQQEIASAFRERARTAHPDKGGDPALFLRLKQARDVLCDPVKRAAYDRNGEEAVTAPEAPRGPDQHASMQVSMMEAIRGVQRAINVNRNVPCSSCRGSGVKSDLTERQRANMWVPCQVCRGTKMLHNIHPCPACGASGRTLAPSCVCSTCGGRRMKSEIERIPFDVPAGSGDGDRIRIPTENSDIVITIKIQSQDGFEALHHHLMMQIELTLIEAIAGGERTIVHPDGSRKHLRFDGGVQHGDVILFQGLGLGDQGALVFRVSVKIPRIAHASNAREVLEQALVENTSMPPREHGHEHKHERVWDRHTIMSESDFLERVHAEREGEGGEGFGGGGGGGHGGPQVQCSQS